MDSPTMAVKHRPLKSESFLGRQKLFKNVWTGATSSASTKRTKPKQRKIIRTARIDDDKPPVILHKFKRKIRAKKMVNVCNKILNYCEEHGLAKHILAKQAEEGAYGVKTKVKRKRRRVRVKKLTKKNSIPHTVACMRAVHVKCEKISLSQQVTPQTSHKKKPRRKKKIATARKTRTTQNSETVRSWLNIELLKQSINKDNWPEGEEAELKTPRKPNSATDIKIPPNEAPRKSESVKECPKESESVKKCSQESLRAIRKRKKSTCSNSIRSKIESIKEVMTPVDSSMVVPQKEAMEMVAKTVESATKSFLKTGDIKPTNSKNVSVSESTTESMGSVQKKVTDYVAYLKLINSRTRTDTIDNFKEAMRVVESRRSIPITRRVLSKTMTSNTSVPVTVPKSTATIRRFSSTPLTNYMHSLPTTKDDQTIINKNVAVTSVQSTKSPGSLSPMEVRKIVRSVESASYPSTSVCITPSTSWRSYNNYGMTSYTNRKQLSMNKISIP